MSRIVVHFSGPGAGTAPLTWGQKAIMQDMRETGWTHNSSGAHNLPAGTTVEDLAERLRGLMSRHPALRTRLSTGPDGMPCQVVHSSGEIDLEVVDIADDVEPANAAKRTDQMWFDWLLTPIDPYTQWPVRMAVVRHRGAPRYLVLTFGHIVVDGSGIAQLMPELGIGCGGSPAPARPAGDPVQQLELARREQTPQVRRLSDRAMRYWEAQLRSIPPLTFGEPRYRGRLGQRYWHGRFHSPAAYLAVLAIANRTRTDTSRVLLAVIATAIGRATGVDPLTAKVIVSNRFRPGFAGAIATLGQNSVLTIDLADATVDEVVAQARRASMVAGLHAYYDPDQLDQLIARLDRERGYPARVTCRINDRRLTTRQEVEDAVRGATVTMEEIQAKTAETWLSWDGPLDHLPEQAFITIEDYHETVHLQVIFDTACLTEEQVEALLHGVEEVAIEAAFDPAVPTQPGSMAMSE
jgi:Condensation domain